MFLRNMICASIVLLTSSAFAQAPGGGQPGQSTPPTLPEQRPGMNNPSDTPTETTSKVDDKKFVKDAAMGGMAEVELGKLAVQKAASDDVKQFAQKVIDDHTKANDQLKEVAARDKIDIPNALDAKHQSKIEKLSKLSGTEFDKAYVKDRLKDHQSDVGKFTAEAQHGSDPKVKAFASGTLPVLQQHLEIVKNLHKSEKGTAKQTKVGS